MTLLACFCHHNRSDAVNTCTDSLSPVSFRSARGDDLCPFYSGHSYLRPSNDVFNHPPDCFLHRVDLWRWHHAHAVFHEHTVRLASVFMHLSCLFIVHYIKVTFFIPQSGRGLRSRKLCKWLAQLKSPFYLILFTLLIYNKLNNITNLVTKLQCSASQSSAVLDGSQRRSTKQESAWPFRIWYNFDHKYPLNFAYAELKVLSPVWNTRGRSLQPSRTTVSWIKTVLLCFLT